MLELLGNFVAGAEWIWIVVILGVLLFGAKKIPELARTFGKAKGEYEKASIEADKELNEFKKSKQGQQQDNQDTATTNTSDGTANSGSGSEKK